eukprot:TRINITY_DN50_c0_g1_i1.p1 TRINITY_DN50_c0_g1~~TRINITY_DN50_c0_g1_i1.p1  ORF type:complete len:933 (+),score=207.25 TRINITY_DN50_c0_g1_i1:903-3701(+)
MAPVQSTAPVVQSMAPRQSTAPVVQSMAPRQSTAPVVQSMAPGTQSMAPTGSFAPSRQSMAPGTQSMAPTGSFAPSRQSMAPGTQSMAPTGSFAPSRQSMAPGTQSMSPSGSYAPSRQSMAPSTSYSPSGSMSPGSWTQGPAGSSVAPTIAPTAVPTPVPRSGCACTKGQICVEGQQPGTFTCVTNGCAFKQCGNGKTCKMTYSGPTCEQITVNPCEPNPCPDTTFCVLEGTNHTCEPVVTDPCAICSPNQRCTYSTARGVACVDVDSCTAARRRLNLDDCVAPKKCQYSQNVPDCVDPAPAPTTCVAASCEARGMVCGPNGDCVENKCADFSWPPAGVQFCGTNGGCPAGMKCTGCTTSGSCDKVTGETTFGNDCRPTCEAFTLTCDVTSRSTWTADEVRDCCTVAGIGCSTYDCLDTTPVEQWTTEQKEYCCSNAGKGCLKPAGEYDCLDGSDSSNWEFAKRKWCCENKQIGCPVGYDCGGVSSSWSVDQAAYCCKNKNKGCTPSNGFDCTWNNQTIAPWTDKQKEWCCTNEGVRCPPKDPFTCPDDESLYTSAEQRSWCCANKNRACSHNCQVKGAVRQTWSEATRSYCCLYEGIKCNSNTNDFDCFDTSTEWTADRKAYCCKEEDIGCKTECTAAADTLTTAEKTECCDRAGLHCDPPTGTPAVIPDGMERVKFRLNFRGNWNTASKSPLRMFRKFRMSLYAASKTFRSGSVSITVNFMGALMSGNYIAPDSSIQNWQFRAQASWNVDVSPLPSVITSKSRSVSTLANTFNEAMTSTDGIYFEYDGVGTKEDLDAFTSEIAAASLEGAQEPPTGAFGTNNEGFSLILPASENEVLETRGAAGGEGTPEPTPKDDDDTNLTWLWILLGCLFALCMGAAGFVMYKKNGDAQRLDDFLTDMEGLEELSNTHSPADHDAKLSQTNNSVVARV